MELATTPVNAPNPIHPKTTIAPNDRPPTVPSVEEALESFGLLKSETRVYLHLAKTGPRKAKDITNEVKIRRTETYRILRHLEKKGLVFLLLKKPIKFSAVPINEAIDLLIEGQRTKLRLLENQKEVIAGLWAVMPLGKCEAAKKELFQKLESEQQIIQKANEILERTSKELQIFISDEYIADFYFGGFFDKLKWRQELNVKLLTSLSQKSTYFLGKIKWPHEKHQVVEAQNVSSFIVSDRNELLIAFNGNDAVIEMGHKKKQKKVAIWTNYGALVSVLDWLFAKLLSSVSYE
ncbi:MAG: hypothetical protein NWE93_01855 [Candidatus Bathyarchaeota archaeon]|nr:hypothetical protein [Candidatus Bathyarchaeota archaeon]